MRFTKFFTWVLVGIFLFGTGRIIEQGFKAQWDFGVYYAAALAFQKNLNPYLNANLTAAWPERPSQLPFVYPPITLWFFSIFGFWPAHTAVLIWGLMKAAALAVWILLLRSSKLFSSKYFDLKTILIFTLSFQAPILLDFTAGNITVFETLTLWTAIAFLLNSQFFFFSACIAALAQFKIFTAVFVVLPILIFGKKYLKHSIFAAFFVLVLASFNFIFFKSWISDFFLNQTPLSEHGVSNPSSYAFSGALLGVLNGLAVSRVWEITGWVLIVVFWVVQLRKVLRTAHLSKLQKICFTVLIYGLCVPRFIDYSFALVLPAAALAFGEILLFAKIEEILILMLFLFYPVSGETIPRTWFSRAFTEYHPYVGLTLLSYFWSQALLGRRTKKLGMKPTERLK